MKVAWLLAAFIAIEKYTPQLTWGAFPKNNYGRKFRRYQ